MNDNINKELTNIHNWLLAHRLSFNVLKLNVLCFTCHKKVEEVDHLNFLGLIIDRNMKWHTHVQKVANRIRNANGILHKFKHVFLHTIYIYIYFFKRITH